MTRIDPHSFLADFLEEASELVDTVEQGLLHLPVAPGGEREGILESVLRDLHTLKGNAGMMGMSELQSRLHGLEDAVAELDSGSPDVDTLLPQLDEARELLASVREPEGELGAAAPGGLSRDRLPASVRVSFTALDALVDRLMEVVIFRNRLADALESRLKLASSPQARQVWRELSQAETALAKTLDRLRGEIMVLRMVPLVGVFERLRRVVHDESRARGKLVEFRVEGGRTPVDKALLELASEALGHLVRNAVVHGVEDPETRERRGKPPVGRLEIAAEVRSDELVIRVEDDGAGIDVEALNRRAASQGLLPEGPTHLFEVVFLPGVSSQADADLGAGRGMGLAAVQEAVKRQGGHIEVSSRPGEGTRFDLFLPLVVSITGALIVVADEEEYALPVAAITETLELVSGQRHEIRDAGVLRWRGRTVPLLDLGTHFGTRREPRREGLVVIVEVGEKLRGLVVDRLEGLREIVVKSLDREVLGQPRGILGSTILGDGRAVLILDPSGLMDAPVGREKSA
jgi:two-component system chemotaxis sensor kinase CheA